MKLWKILAAVSLIFVLTFSAACGFSGQQDQSGQGITVSRGDLTVKVNGTGKAIYDNDAKLAFGSSGKIKELPVTKGDSVTQGTMLARLDTDNLELTLSQAKVAQAQAQTALIQTQVMQTQAQSSITQAETGLAAAQFNLDRTKAVSDIKDEITKIQWKIQIAEMRIQETLATSERDAADYWARQVNSYRTELNDQNKKLADLLDNDEYQGQGALTYNIMGQTYDRLTVEDARMKQLQVESAQQAVDQAKQNLELAKQNVQQATQSVEQSQQNIAYISKQIKESTIVAPFDGVIAGLDVKKGDFLANPGVNSGAPIYMVDIASLEISTEIDEIDMANINLNQKALISVDAFPNSPFEGSVKAISLMPIVKPQNSGVVVYEVKIGFSGTPPTAVKSGMSASVDIITHEKKNVLLVPNKSIKRNQQGQTVVNVINNQKLEERPVVLGLTDGSQTEIINGLNAGEVVWKPVKESSSKLG